MLPSIIVIGLLLSFDSSAFLRTNVVEGRIIPSGSMLPTIQIQDRVMVAKGAYSFKEPAFGDIIIFQPPDELGMKDDFIKRVIGLPGDTIDIKQGKVYRNGKALNEPYIMEAPNYEFGPIKVPAKSLYVMGDNRNQSYDSHLWNGWVTMDHVKGKVTSIYWPISHRKSLEEN
ncbi:MAG: signal peptidase I [Ignavibacteriales bacterium]